MNKIITKSVLLKQIQNDTGMSIAEVHKLLNGILDNIQLTLAINGGVNVRGFGKFDAVQRKGRKFKNIQTGKTVKSPDRRIPVFKASSVLKNKCEAVKSIDFRKEGRRKFIFELEVLNSKNIKLFLKK